MKPADALTIIRRARDIKRAARMIQNRRRRELRTAARKAGTTVAKLKRERFKAAVDATFEAMQGKLVRGHVEGE